MGGRWEKDFLLVNTLDEEHFDATRIPGATNIPQSHDDFVRRVEELGGGKDKQVVVTTRPSGQDACIWRQWAMGSRHP